MLQPFFYIGYIDYIGIKASVGYETFSDQNHDNHDYDSNDLKCS